LSQELLDKSIQEEPLSAIMSFNHSFVPDSEAIEKKGREMMKVFWVRARMALLAWSWGIAILDILIIQLWLLYFTIKTVIDVIKDAEMCISQELWPQVRQRNLMITTYITPIIKRSVDSILYNSETKSKIYTDQEVKDAISLLEDLFIQNGWKEYFEIAKTHYPYMNYWMK